ncbi:MAG: hypothetical protein NC339_03665 [Muribaculaceae bacterium]|nr:hypothetical protein [Muribaculaceae bacterium]
MCNAAIKAIIITASLLVLIFSPSCSTDNGEKEASALVQEAAHALEVHSYKQAKLLVDSINHAYPRAIEARRQAMHIGARAVEGITLFNLELSDQQLAILSARADSLKSLVKYVSNPIEGYYVAVGANPDDILNVSGIQARLSPEGDFYLISTLKGKGIKSTSVTVTADGDTASTSAVGFDGERNDRSSGQERITFIAAECDSVGRLIYYHPTSKVTLTFNGEGGATSSLTLPQKTVRQIATLYDYALTMRRARQASLDKEKYTRALDTSRSQAARTYIEEDKDEE